MYKNKQIKILALTLVFCILTTGCYYKKLGCVICKKHTSTQIDTLHEPFAIIIKKSIVINKFIDGNEIRRKTCIKKDSTGHIFYKSKNYSLGNVWMDWPSIFKTKTTKDTVSGKYLIKNKMIMRNGTVVENRMKFKKKIL